MCSTENESTERFASRGTSGGPRQPPPQGGMGGVGAPPSAARPHPPFIPCDGGHKDALEVPGQAIGHCYQRAKGRAVPFSRQLCIRTSLLRY